MRPRLWLGFTALGALALTLMVSVTSVVHVAYRSPELHVAVETAATLIALLAAQLTYGRFRRSLSSSDLLLTAALVLIASANLLFSAVPAITNTDAAPFATWASAVTSLLGAVLFAAGAVAAPRRISRPRHMISRTALGLAVALAVIAAATALAGDWLPSAVPRGLSPDAASHPRIVGPPVLLAMQLVVMALFAVAAAGFVRAAERTHDPLMHWFAIGATLAAFARLNYFLFPSRYSDFFYTGDVMRLGFLIALLLGGVYEIRVAQRQFEQAAAHDERRRLARDIHDGMAQDLAFIVQQADALERQPGSSPVLADISIAARRALDESRGVIAALVGPSDEPFGDALTRVARDAAARWGAAVEPRTVGGVELGLNAREALLRIVGEAVTNAARHGHAQHIRLELTDSPRLAVKVADDGVGFDPTSLNGLVGHHGIMGMRERAEQIGAQICIDSRPGDGTKVVVTL